MKKRSLRLMVIILVCTFFCTGHAAAQNNRIGSISGKHRGAVTALLVEANGRILSTGEDGFLGIWNGRSAEDRFQLSPFEIKSIVLRPGKTQIAVVESEGPNNSRVSVWDYTAKKNLFTLRFKESISCVNYSAAGSFLIISCNGQEGTAIVHPETGEILKLPETPSSISLSATGISERVMISYSPSGVLSYLDLESGDELERLFVPSNIQRPILFGNNRFLGGFDFQGLLVLDTVTGMVLARDQSIFQGTIFIEDPGSSQFNCLIESGEKNSIVRMQINLAGSLTSVSRRDLSAIQAVCAAFGNGGNIFLGTNQGELWVAERNRERILESENPERIVDLAVSSSLLALLSENGAVSYLPADYSKLKNGDSLDWEEYSGSSTYNGIAADSQEPADSKEPAASKEPADSQEPVFLLWQNGRSIPVLIAPEAEPVFLEKLAPRFPIRSVAILGKNILFLNSAGTVSVMDAESGNIRFNYSASGSVDAVFSTEDTIILGRSALALNSVFMMVNISSGETVPLAYPALIGVRLYRGASGTIYAAVINRSATDVETSIIKLDISNPASSVKIAEYGGEDSSFAMAESGGNFASSLGDGTAAIYLNPRTNADEALWDKVFLERSAGLPVKIVDGGDWFIVLDGEGGISWHNNQTGKLLAVLRFYPDSWVLRMEGENIRGKTMPKTS